MSRLKLCVAVFLGSAFLLALIRIYQVKYIHWKKPGPDNQDSKMADYLESMMAGSQELNYTFLEAIPRDFQEKMLSGIPLNCHPGPEGVLREVHRKFLLTLVKYEEEHRQMVNSPSPRTLIWICAKAGACSGLGDRLRGLTHSLLFAIFTHRKLVIFLEGAYEFDNVLPNIIDWRDEDAHQRFKKGLPHLRNTYDALRGNESDVVLTGIERPATLISRKESWIQSALKWSGLADLSAEDCDAIVGLATRFLFKFVKEMIELYKARYSLGLTGLYTALHVRTGFAGTSTEEYKSEKLFKGLKEWQRAINLSVSVADRSLGRDSLIFLSADSIQLKNLALSMYPRRFVTIQEQAIHVGMLYYHSTPTPQEKNGLSLVWTEMFLLAESSILVRGNSGFSWVASFLCSLQVNSTVIYTPKD